MKVATGVIAFLISLVAWQPNETIAQAAPSSSLPKVEMSTRRVRPREIEDLTRNKILRDYASAWQTLATGLEQNRSDLLNNYFTGPANQEFTKAIGEQAAVGMHRQYLNQGHKLEVIFYSPDGGLMQLWDSAEYEVRIFDGNQLLHTERTATRFLVLMTPASDRWMVRLLQNVPVS